MNKKIELAFNQGIADYVRHIIYEKNVDFSRKVEAIIKMSTESLNELELNKTEGIKNILNAEKKIADVIKSNRGGKTGVHGFIAEFAEEGISNSRDNLKGLKNIVQAINDNGNADLIVNGNPVQVKFYNNLLNELRTSKDYRDMTMMFPKDHYELYQKIMNGEKDIIFRGEHISLRKINAIKDLIEKENNARGCSSYEEWMMPSKLNYDQVQKGTIKKTLKEERKDFNDNVKETKAEIKDNEKRKIDDAKNNVKPNLNEANKIALQATIIQAALSFSLNVYNKHKEGKEIWEFNVEDWKEVGLSVGKDSLRTGVSSYAIYGLTSVCKLSSPSASAITSGTLGLLDATLAYRSGELNYVEFIDAVGFNTLEATISALGASLGQAIIPIPVLGAIIGSISTSLILSMGEDFLSKREIELVKERDKSIKNYLNELDEVYKNKYDELIAKFDKINNLEYLAFDLELNINLRLSAGIDLARELNVREDEILHNVKEIDDYFLN